MMFLQLGETFSGFKKQRPVQWLIRTQYPLLFKYNELAKLFVPPPPPEFLKACYGPTVIGGTRYFGPSVSLTEENLSHVLTRLKMHHHISIKLYLFNNEYQLNRNISIYPLGQSRGI